MRKLLGGSGGALLASACNKIDQLRDGEDCAVAGNTDSEPGNDDEDGLVDQLHLREKGETEVDEDEVLAQLCQNGKNVFCGALSLPRHVVVGVVLEGNAAEEQGHDAAHVCTV